MVQEGDEDDDKSKAFDTKQFNLSLPMVAHLGFHVHPITTPITKATHIGTRNTIVPVHTPTIFGLSNNSCKASNKAVEEKKNQTQKKFSHIFGEKSEEEEGRELAY